MSPPLHKGKRLQSSVLSSRFFFCDLFLVSLPLHKCNLLQSSVLNSSFFLSVFFERLCVSVLHKMHVYKTRVHVLCTIPTRVCV